VQSVLTNLGAAHDRPGRGEEGRAGSDDVVRRFHELYYRAADRGGTWRSTTWMGVPVSKCPLDLWVYQEIFFEVRPELVIECGTYAGGSALFLAHLCDLLGKGLVLTIDVEPRPLPTHPRLARLVGSSIAPETVAQVRRFAAGRGPVLVALDSDHHFEHVLQELRLYGPLVTPGSYLVVEDPNVNGHPVLPDFGPGPQEAVQQFLGECPDFETDRTREKFLLTFNPGGFLRRRPHGLSPVVPGSCKRIPR
jgi:cephalosporin hydroxylase